MARVFADRLVMPLLWVRECERVSVKSSTHRANRQRVYARIGAERFEPPPIDKLAEVCSLDRVHSVA